MQTLQRLQMEKFQPTLPARGATPRSIKSCRGDVGFQPTLPARGATLPKPARQHGTKYFNPRSPHGERHSIIGGIKGSISISTHAPRTGSDHAAEGIYTHDDDFNPRSPHGERRGGGRRAEPVRGHFNPRSPHGERLFVFRQKYQHPVFQPTLPARGATTPSSCPSLATGRFQPTLPARGATVDYAHNQKQAAYFNPRSPHGERQAICEVMPMLSRFQPTLPARGATCFGQARQADQPFQPTLPARGATMPPMFFVNTFINFNPRSPHGERRLASGLGFMVTHTISTHAPRTGSDRHRHPCSGGAVPISTHAPRTGSDRRKIPKSGQNCYFNPRSPHGERRRRATD